MSMAQGLATLETIDEDKIQQNALNVGAYLKEQLTGLMQKHKLIGEVRGLGLMLGMESLKLRPVSKCMSLSGSRLMVLSPLSERSGA